MLEILPDLIKLRRNTQRERIAVGNRIDAIMREHSKMGQMGLEIYQRCYARRVDEEDFLGDEIEKVAQTSPIIQAAINVKGVGVMTISRVVGEIDIRKCPTVSSLWRYCGFGVIDGKAERKKKSEVLHYNEDAKISCRVLGDSLLKANSPYRAIYDDAKLCYNANREWSKGHVHNAAMRKMIKIFLSHLWVKWREMEGLAVSEPYIIGKDGHSHYHTPEEFGWEH